MMIDVAIHIIPIDANEWSGNVSSDFYLKTSVLQEVFP